MVVDAIFYHFLGPGSSESKQLHSILDILFCHLHSCTRMFVYMPQESETSSYDPKLFLTLKPHRPETSRKRPLLLHVLLGYSVLSCFQISDTNQQFHTLSYSQILAECGSSHVFYLLACFSIPQIGQLPTWHSFVCFVGQPLFHIICLGDATLLDSLESMSKFLKQPCTDKYLVSSIWLVNEKNWSPGFG